MGKTSSKHFTSEYIRMRTGTQRDAEHQEVIEGHKLKALCYYILTGPTRGKHLKPLWECGEMELEGM